MPAGGYFGRALVVDVGTGTAQTLELPDELLRAYIGGAGLGAWLMHKLGPPGVDPLAPEAPLAYVFSPLVGTPLTTSAKFAVVAKSPLTGMLTDALASSHFAIAGKLTGYDAIVVTGACATPSALLIDQDGVRIQDAADLAGLTAAQAGSRCGSGWGSSWAGAGGWRRSGQAGERGVRYATISHDGRHAGRGGLGAVLGAKRIKAIAVRAAAKVAPADPDAVLAAARDLRERSFGPATAKYRELGTLANLLAFNAISTLPTQNFQAATFDGAHEPGRRGPGRGAPGGPAQLRLLHDRLRAHLRGQDGPRDPGGVRERLRPRPDVRGVRSGRGAGRQRALRRPGAGHHLGRRHDRLGHGVRRARPDRRAVAAVRRRQRTAQGPGPDRREGRPRRPARRRLTATRRGRSATDRNISRRTSRAWSCPATSRGRCTPWRWAWR